MFSKCINETPLTGRFVDDFFPKIIGTRYRDDISFVASLRAFLKDRIGDAEVIFNTNGIGMAASDVKSANPENLFKSIFEYPGDAKNRIQLTYADNVDGAAEAFAAQLDDEAHGFVANYEGYKEAQDLRVFAEKHVNARFYINEEQRSTVIFVVGLDQRRFHFLQTMIPRYLPWFFKGTPLTDLEKRIAISLNNRYATDYEAILQEIRDTIDLRDHMIKAIVGGFEKNSRAQQLENVRNEANATRRRIEENVASYRDLISMLDGINIRMLGLQAMVDSADENSELVDFFTRNKQITPVDASGTHLQFIVKGYLDIFDPDMYAKMASNDRSHLFTDYSIENSKFRLKATRKKFLDAIFGEDAVLKIKCCAFYDVDLRGDVSSSRGYGFPAEFKDFAPNPHLEYHNCLGNHRQFISECLRNGDMLGAVSQCISSARSINIGEGMTVSRFLKFIFGTDKKIIELPDGTSMTPVDALEWLGNQRETPKE